jgi:eukaryotic-like serine/threonine-protein kinase
MSPLPDARQTGLRFEVLAPIATGSTARVDLCRSLGPREAGQLVAVKRLLPEHQHDRAISKRFLDEVWMTSALRHPHVVDVVGWGTDEAGPYLAVELVQGVSLGRLAKTVFDTGEQFPERLVVYIGLCVARGLGAAHDLSDEQGRHLGLIHRDLSAQNVLLSFSGDVKIADFGLAKAKDRLSVTTSELPTRALAHVAPEELRQQPTDHRSDLFSFGVMLFELLTGRLPFEGKDDIQLVRSIVGEPTPDPLHLRPKMDKALAALVRRCLEKLPERRWQSAHEIAGEFDAWLYAHGYTNDNVESLGRFVRRNSMRQMRWFERVIAGEPEPQPTPSTAPPEARTASARASMSDISAASGPTRRNDAEVTAVESGKSSGGPKRTRSSDTVAAAGKSRRREGSLSAITVPEAFMSEPSTSGDDDNVPTVAIRLDAQLRTRMAQAQAEALASSAPKPTARSRGPLGTMLDLARGALAPRAAAPAGESAQPPTNTEASALGARIDAELARVAPRIEQLRANAERAREAAQQAARDAEAAERELRRAEELVAALERAHHQASSGDAAEAGRGFEEVRVELARAKL